MNITKWFDPAQPEHREAYRLLLKRGSWPKGFIPEGTEFSPVWHVELASSLAGQFLNEMRRYDKDGRPTFGAWAQEEE